MYAGLGKSRNPEKRFIILITRSVVLTSFVRAKNISPLRHYATPCIAFPLNGVRGYRSI